MPFKPPSRCTSCKKLHGGTGKCDDCQADARRESDHARGTAAQRGYGHQHQIEFRAGVLRKHPTCQCADPTCKHHVHGFRYCCNPSRVADHYPRSRRELVAAGLDPNDPAYGRGLCTPCHNHHTATHQPGGWNR